MILSFPGSLYRPQRLPLPIQPNLTLRQFDCAAIHESVRYQMFQSSSRSP